MLTKLAPQPKWQEPAIRHVPASPAWRQSSALKWRRCAELEALLGEPLDGVGDRGAHGGSL